MTSLVYQNMKESISYGSTIIGAAPPSGTIIVLPAIDKTEAARSLNVPTIMICGFLVN
jgi:hypothetical protein